MARSVVACLMVAGMAVSSALLHAQPPAQNGHVDPDQQFVETTCSTCHPIAQVRAKHLTPEDWAVTVDRMIGLGAQISEDDRDRVIAYLAAHQGPQ